MSRYIDADALKKRVSELIVPDWTRTLIRSWLDSEPTIDAVPVLHSRWVYNDEDYIPYCENCLMPSDTETKYCASCGAIMDGKEQAARLIDADALERDIMSMPDDDIDEDSCNNVINVLDKQPTVDAVPVVFVNDPFRVVYQAFKELYPDKECEILFDYNVETTDTHERVKGVTIFPDDGSIPQIRIDCEQTIDQISGILAHELAHVACGKPEWDDRELDHGEDFEKVLDAIFDRFNELQGFRADGERRSDEQ